MKKIIFMTLLSVGMLNVGIAQAIEGRAELGQKKISMCVGCHGIPGYKITFPETYHVPKLGGQYSAYIVSALTAYKNGDRKNPTMQAIAASLSDKDMADIAAYYGIKKP